jgi:hypothetical protein
VAEALTPPPPREPDRPTQPHSWLEERPPEPEPAREGSEERAAEPETRPLPSAVLAAGEDEDVVTPHRSRFNVLFFVLGAVSVLAGALAVGLAVGRGAQPDLNWSMWHPTRGGDVGAQQIADHVGPNYRLPNGKQLVAVRGGELAIQNIPTRIVLNAGAGGAGKIQLVQGESVLYSLCGLGTRCSIRSGKPSVTRHVLLQREALELALYSFHYLKAKNVVVLMPPPPGEKRSEAMFFRSKEFGPQLDQPLRQTLRATTLTVDDFPASGEADAVQRLTAPRDFQFSLIQGQDATLLLVLDPFGG